MVLLLLFFCADKIRKVEKTYRSTIIFCKPVVFLVGNESYNPQSKIERSYANLAPISSKYSFRKHFGFHYNFLVIKFKRSSVSFKPGPIQEPVSLVLSEKTKYYLCGNTKEYNTHIS